MATRYSHDSLWRRFAVALVFALGLIPLAAVAQGTGSAPAAPPQAVPDSGLAAEGRGQWRAALAIYQDALATAAPAQAATLLQRMASIHVRLGEPERAADLLAEATRQTPEDAALWRALSQARAALGQRQAALTAINRVLALNPDDLAALRAQARLANWQGDHATATRAYRAVLAQQPRDPEALLGLARTLSWQGDYRLADRSYDTYLSVHGGNRQVWLEHIDVRIAQREFDPALNQLQRYRQRFGEDQASWRRSAQIEAVRGNVASATAAWEQVARLAPDDAEAQASLSGALAARGDKAAALQRIDRALALDPNNLDYLRARARLANWNGYYGVSADSYARILDQRPGDRDALLGLARARQWQGEPAAALPVYRQLLRGETANSAVLRDAIRAAAQAEDAAQARAWAEQLRRQAGESRDYWLLVAEMETLLGDRNRQAAALDRAAEFDQGDADWYFQLAQQYPADAVDAGAVAAAERAVALDPDNIDYLHLRADLAAWRGDYATAVASYQRILELDPEDPAAMLGLARVSAWAGDQDRAVTYYRRYLERYPQVHQVWLETIEMESYNGNYPDALALLADYRQRFGESESYQRLLARIRAWQGRPTQALNLVSALQPGHPDDRDLLYTRAVALDRAHRPRAMLDTLAALDATDPGRADAVELRRILTTPLRSRINLRGLWNEDNNDVGRSLLGIDGVYVANPETAWLAGWDRQWLRAPLGSGYETVDGDTNARYDRAWLGVSHRFNPRWAGTLKLGAGQVADGGDNPVASVRLDYQARDDLALGSTLYTDLLAVSPRAVDEEVEKRAWLVDGAWAIDDRYSLYGQGEIAEYDPDNTSWALDLSGWRALVRRQHHNVDVGLSARWFGFDQDPGLGYYAPEFYQRYGVNGHWLWKISDDDQIGVTVSPGMYKDDSLDNFKFAGDITVEGYFGLYRDWMLYLRGSLSRNGGSATGAFRESTAEAVLTRRF